MAVLIGTHVAHPQLPVGDQQLLPDQRPQPVGDVHPGAGGALLTPELKGRAQRAAHHAGHVGGAMHEVEVLTAALWGGGVQSS